MGYGLRIQYRFAKIKSLEDFYIQNYVCNFLIQFQYETNDLHNIDFLLVLRVLYNDAVDGFKVT